MQIRQVTETEHADFLSLVNAEIRPDRAKTNAWEDFPLILGAENLENQLVALTEEGTVVGGIASLIRCFKTSCGNVAVGGVGSVVTHPEYRGKGLSSTLQNEMLDHLRRKNVPLAVLWTDQPEIYAGRGFQPAGWELHAQIGDCEVAGPGKKGLAVRQYQPEDCQAVERLYLEHPFCTRRESGDSEALYGMAGTRGLVGVNASDEVVASVFCGKGGDFPGYVTEWAGKDEFALPLLLEAKARGLADQVLIPPGREEMVNRVVDLGGAWFAMASGFWCVLDGKELSRVVTIQGQLPPEDLHDAAGWLGTVDDLGQPLVGPLTVAVWGFDSV